MRKLLSAFRRDDSDAAMMEYAILVGLIAVSSIGSIQLIGGEIKKDFALIAKCLATPSDASCK